MRKPLVRCFSKAIVLNPNDAVFCYDKGTSLNTLNRYDEAIECFNQAIRLNPIQPNFYFSKGLCLNALNKNAEALRCFDEVHKLNPNDLEIIGARNLTFWNSFKKYA